MIAARAIIIEIVNYAFRGVAKKAGFTKTNLNFYRRRGETFQIIFIQLSHGNFGSEGQFYVNVGIAFDRLRQLAEKPLVEKLQAHQCCFHQRLQHIVPQTPAEWLVDAQTDIPQVGELLASRCKILIDQLDQIDSIASFLARGWLNGGADFGLLARMEYVEGNFAAAAEAVQKEAYYFRDRKGASVEKLLQRYRLEELAPYIAK